MEEKPRAEALTFFDLPSEIRDMVYAYFPHHAFIHINQTRSKLQQPAIARVSRRMREEALAVFYTRNKFVLDLRGWKDASYPEFWTPADVFHAWVDAIGDRNASHLRRVKFFAANFRVVVKISGQVPASIDWTMRVNKKTARRAETVPHDYTFSVAAERVRSALASAITAVETAAREQERPLGAADLVRINDAVSRLQPYLCTAMGLGFMGAILGKESSRGGHTAVARAHVEKCNDCYRHRTMVDDGVAAEKLRKAEEAAKAKGNGR